MRLALLTRLQLDSTYNTLSYSGPDSERFTIQVLDHDLIRVQMHPDGTPRLDRTWTIVGPDGDVPREGRHRDDIAHFPQPAPRIQPDGDQVRITTDMLTITLDMRRAALRWQDAAGRIFAEDRPTAAYARGRAARGGGYD